MLRERCKFLNDIILDICYLNDTPVNLNPVYKQFKLDHGFALDDNDFKENFAIEKL